MFQTIFYLAYKLFLTVCLLLVLAGCGENAVVFAPTPLPPDLSPVRYQGGVFSIDVPRNWSVYSQNNGILAAASFTPPESDQPILNAAVIQLAPDSAPDSITDLINDYQQIVRPDANRYTEQERQVLEDGTWRLKGIRKTYGDLPQQVNTFLQVAGPFVGVVNVTLPNDPELISELEAIVSTFMLNPDVALQPTSLESLSFVTESTLQIINVSSWTATTGVYFVTGEVINTSAEIITSLPIRVELQTSDGTGIAEAVDNVMGYSIIPGGFAPFSLRFGQGQPDNATTFALALGQPESDLTNIIHSGDSMNWTDDSTFTDDGQLLITGTVTNISTQPLRNPLATVTVFDSRQRVIAAAFAPVLDGNLAPEESVPFNIVIPEIGGLPANYIVNIQAYE